MSNKDVHGHALVPGHNVDPVDIEAGLRRLAQLGYDQATHRMEVEYNLMRWARGEEAQADKSMTRSLSGVDYTSWRAVLASAVSAVSAGSARATAHDHTSNTSASPSSST